VTPQLRGHLAMLAFSALVAGSFALGGRMATLVDPGAFTALRFLLATAVVGLMALATGGLDRRAFRAPWRVLLLGGLIASYFVLMFEGLKTAAPVSAAAVFTLTPPMAALFGWLVLRQVTGPRVAFALAVGGAGALWVIFRGDWAAFRSLAVGRGEAVYFVGCAAHALYAPMVRRLNRGEPAASFTFATLSAGTVLLAVWAAPAIRATDWSSLPGIVWITLGYTVVAATAFSFVLLQYATLRLPSAKVMAYTFLVPGWVILWEVALGADWPTAWVAVGMAMTGAALALLLRPETAVTAGAERA
jgi:drug/metabolite transporter (DMT)-like permease